MPEYFNFGQHGLATLILAETLSSPPPYLQDRLQSGGWNRYLKNQLKGRKCKNQYFE
jgi:hypothetical protein